MKILHCADLHIREKDIEEIDRCLKAIVTTAQREAPDLAVIAGDIFDSRDVRVDSQSAMMAIGFVSALMDICPVAIVLGTPSHDGEAPKIMRYARGEFPVIVAEKPEQYILAGGLFYVKTSLSADAILTLIPQPTKQYWQGQGGVSQTDQEIGQALSGIFAGFGAQAAEYPGVPHVLVYHGGISGAKVSTGQVLTGHDIEVSIDQLNLAGADLNLCGHIHMQQQLGDRTFYAGSPYRTNWGELEPKGFYVHTLTPDPLPAVDNPDETDYGYLRESRFIETPCRKVARIKVDFTDDEQAAMFSLPGLVGEGDHARLDFTVWQDEADLFDKETITDELIRQGALSVDIRITRVPRETVRAVEVLDAPTLRLKILEQAKLKGEEVDPGILELADRLEQTPAEMLLQQARGGGV